MDNVAINARALSLQNWVGDIQIFGDLRQVDVNSAIEYYHLNHFQKNNFIWLCKNHLDLLHERYDFNKDVTRSLVTVSRVGLTKSTQLIVLSMTLVDYSFKTAKIIDNRFISLGKKGGRVMLNPQRRGNHVHGSYVLKSIPTYSLLEYRD